MFVGGKTMRSTLGVGLSLWLMAMAFPGGALAQAPGAAPGLPSQPAPHLTTSEATRAFAQAMFFCLGSRLGGQMIKDAPEDLRSAYAPASGVDLTWAEAGEKLPEDTPVWVSRRLGYLLYILEPSPERCEVHANQLPVQAAFQLIVDAMKQQYSDLFTAVAPKPGFSPIAYQFEHVENGVRYVFHMEGTETGLPGREPHISLLSGVVLRQPATDPPAFR